MLNFNKFDDVSEILLEYRLNVPYLLCALAICKKVQRAIYRNKRRREGRVGHDGMAAPQTSSLNGRTFAAPCGALPLSPRP